MPHLLRDHAWERRPFRDDPSPSGNASAAACVSARTARAGRRTTSQRAVPSRAAACVPIHHRVGPLRADSTHHSSRSMTGQADARHACWKKRNQANH